jgi:hypothetical protein
LVNSTGGLRKLSAGSQLHINFYLTPLTSTLITWIS